MAFIDLGSLNFTNAVEGTRAFPVTTIPVGITVLQAAITRGSLDPAIVLAWAIEVSRDGGTSWRPWGAAGTTGGDVINPKTGLVATESDFTLFLEAPADAQTLMRGSLTNSGARMTTRITIRGDTTPIPPPPPRQAHESVAYDNFTETHGNGVTTLTTSSFTITSVATRVAILGMIQDQATATGITSTCGGVSGALVSGTDSGSGIQYRAFIHRVIAPAAGSQTASMSWTNVIFPSLGVMTASGVDQTTPTSGGTSGTGTSATPTITVTTNVGDLTYACGMPQNTLSAPTQTQLWLDLVQTGGGGSRGPGTGTSDVHAWTQTSGLWAMAGVNLKAAVTAAPALTDIPYSRFPKPLLQPRVAFPENR